MTCSHVHCDEEVTDLNLYCSRYCEETAAAEAARETAGERWAEWAQEESGSWPF